MGNIIAELLMTIMALLINLGLFIFVLILIMVFFDKLRSTFDVSK
jgi:hypothetical protein